MKIKTYAIYREILNKKDVNIKCKSEISADEECLYIQIGDLQLTYDFDEFMKLIEELKNARQTP